MPNPVAPTIWQSEPSPAGPLRVTPRELSALWRHDLPESRCCGGLRFIVKFPLFRIRIHLNSRDFLWRKMTQTYQELPECTSNFSIDFFSQHIHFLHRFWATRLPSGFSWDWYLPSTSAGRISRPEVIAGWLWWLQHSSIAITWHIYIYQKLSEYEFTLSVNVFQNENSIAAAPRAPCFQKFSSPSELGVPVAVGEASGNMRCSRDVKTGF